MHKIIDKYTSKLSPKAMMDLFLTASLALLSCVNNDCSMDWWKDTSNPGNVQKNKAQQKI